MIIDLMDEKLVMQVSKVKICGKDFLEEISSLKDFHFLYLYE